MPTAISCSVTGPQVPTTTEVSGAPYCCMAAAGACGTADVSADAAVVPHASAGPCQQPLLLLLPLPPLLLAEEEGVCCEDPANTWPRLCCSGCMRCSGRPWTARVEVDMVCCRLGTFDAAAAAAADGPSSPTPAAAAAAAATARVGALAAVVVAAAGPVATGVVVQGAAQGAKGTSHPCCVRAGKDWT
jgi:hypothetical protein